MFDIIGDIHGHADALKALLRKLDYKLLDGVYQHDKHKAVFLGDFIDRGPQQREVIEIVKPMIEQGYALAVMGNHEFNAICFATCGEDGKPLREHSADNLRQHKEFLSGFADERERLDIIEWFKTLPIYIDTGEIRIIHACWNEDQLNVISPLLSERNCLIESAYPICSNKGTDAFYALETLLKGPEAALPTGVSFRDKDGKLRQHARVKWWVPRDTEIENRLHLGDELTKADRLVHTSIDDGFHYQLEHCPVFVGHYWLNHDIPEPLSDNCACLDYSIAKQGKLVAYRWQGETTLRSENFIWC